MLYIILYYTVQRSVVPTVPDAYLCTHTAIMTTLPQLQNQVINRLRYRTKQCIHHCNTTQSHVYTPYSILNPYITHLSTQYYRLSSSSSAIRASNTKKLVQPTKTITKKIIKKQPFRLDQQNSTNLLNDITWSIESALPLLRCHSSLLYDESIELLLNLNLDPRKPNQSIRGVCILPHGNGKKLRIAVFAKSAEKIVEAREAGADIIGSDELINSIQSGIIEFDRCIATPDMMSVVGRVARILGPRGLMPNPKLGSVTNNLTSAIQEAKQGQVQYKTDRYGIVSSSIGKLSFTNSQIIDNCNEFIHNVLRDKPIGAKGQLLKSAYISSTNGVGIPLDIRNAPFVLQKSQSSRR